MRRLSAALGAGLLACTALSACGAEPDELRLTLTFDPSITNARLEDIVDLTFIAGGDESGEFQIMPDRALNRTERIDYLPRPMSRAITLKVEGLDSSGELVAEGSAEAIAVGPGFHAAEITLVDTMAIGDGGTPDGDTDMVSVSDPTLVAHYMFNEGSGTIAHDSSGKGNDGALGGAPSWVTGIQGSALSFTAAATMVVPAAADLSGSPGLTVCAWMKLSVAGINQVILSDRNEAPYFAAYTFQITTSNQVSLEVDTVDGGYGNSGGSTALAADTWYFVAGVYDGAIVEVFINGVPGGFTNALSGNVIEAINELQIGFNSLQGTLDELRIYGRALSPPELMTLYNNP